MSLMTEHQMNIAERLMENRLLLAEVDGLARALAETYEHLAPRAQARVLTLETALAEIRKKLI